MLLAAGANPCCVDNKGKSALSVASFDIAKLLLGAGADVNSVDEEGKSPLIESVHS
jgi:ankyrin repeat protein